MSRRTGLSRTQWIASVQSVLFFGLAIGVIQPFSLKFATEVASNPVSDIILSNIPVFDVDLIFVYGMLLLIGFIAILCAHHPRRIPFMLNSLSLFIIIRCIFISLTHVGPFLPHTSTEFGPLITHLFFGADFFFSGHTGAPFLMALMYWREKLLRIVFLLWSVVFATIVLLGHLHYSIDVAAAYFITYSIYHLAVQFFPISRQWFVVDDPTEKAFI